MASDKSASLELSAFAKVPLTHDLWHARIGHVGGEAARRLHLIATGVKVERQEPLTRCEPCIMAKHPHKPYPPSESEPTSLVNQIHHADVCGPFPVQTPHGKLHMLVIQDDFT
ncbi:hypothetical protein BJ138DRAFT_1020459, partial [Hygrophoropsis aurantiaca]